MLRILETPMLLYLCYGALGQQFRRRRSYFSSPLTLKPSLSPIIGGVFSNPATQWPNALGRIRFLREHPYFLPCAVSGFIALATFILAALALKEVDTLYHYIFWLLTRSLQTLPSLVAKSNLKNLETASSRDREIRTPDETIETPLINHEERFDYGTITPQSSPFESTTTILENKPTLFNHGLIIIYFNYACLAFLDMSHIVLLPLFYSTSISSGGLGLDPFKIGVALGSFGCVNAILQVRFLGPFIRKFGARKMYLMSFPCFFFCLAPYPIMRYLVQRFGRVNYLVIICMIIQLSFRMSISCSYGTCLYSRLSYPFWSLIPRFYAGCLGAACIW